MTDISANPPFTQEYTAQCFPPSPNGTGVFYGPGEETNPGSQLTVPFAANYNTTTNPVKFTSSILGLLCFITNLQFTSVKFVGPSSSDTGLILKSGATALVGIDPFGKIFSISADQGLAPVISTNYWVDPQNSSGNASDNNSGTSSLTPLLTLAKWTSLVGGQQPDFGSSNFVTLTLMSDTNALDPLEVRPSSGILVVVGTSTQQATGTLTSFTAKNKAGATQTQINVAAMVWTPFIGMIWHDTTLVNGAWAWIKSDSGGGTAVISQPLASALNTTGAFPAEVTPGNTDNFEILRVSTVHVVASGSLFPTSTIIFQRCNVTSPSSIPAPSGIVSVQNGPVFQECFFNSEIVASSILQSDTPGLPVANDGRPLFSNCVMSKGCQLGDPIIAGGTAVTPCIFRPSLINCIYDGGLIIEGAATCAFSDGGRHNFGDVGIFAATPNFGGSGQGREGQAVFSTGTSLAPYTGPTLWGPAGYPIRSGGLALTKTNFVTDLLLTGTISLAGVSASYNTFDATTGTIAHVAAPVTQAAIDAAPGGGIFDPLHQCAIVKEA